MREIRRDPLFRFLDTNGNGTGTKNAIGSYSNTPFFITPDNVRQRFIIHRVIWYIEDETQGITLATYGGITALTSGILVELVRKDGTTFDLLDGEPIKDNSDLARLCFDVTISSYATGNNNVHARWTFSKSGAPIILNYGDKLQFVMRDNLSGLTEHYFFMQGYIE